jgi:hypothetical protein
VTRSAPIEVVFVPPDHWADAAADALGWQGVVLPPMVLLYRRVVAVATLLNDVHENRTRSGWGPVTDRMVVSTWDWPELRQLAPPPAVHLNGIIAPARHWRTGLTGVAPFARLCPTAILVPAQIARTVECLHQTTTLGSAVVCPAESQRVDVLHPGWSLPIPQHQWGWEYWLTHELVYDHFLNTHS